MKPLLIVVLFAVLGLGCSPEKRLQRLLALHPELNRTDTVTVHDTLYAKADTVYRRQFLPIHDTVRIDTGRLHIRLIRTAADTFIINGRCDTVFITHETKVEVPRVVPCPPGYGGVKSYWRVVALVLFAVLALYYIANNAMKQNK